MKSQKGRVTRLRRAFGIALALLTVPLLAAATVAAGGLKSDLHDVRKATEAFKDVAAAEAAGYARFYVCTDETGQGAMGQHYVNLDLVLDPAVDPLRPEALMYEPKKNGKLKLVGVEYVTFAALWHDEFGAATPTVLGLDMKLTPSPNRYGLDPFYQRHAWIWKKNPSGTFNDWNPKVSCRGKGD